MKENVKAKQNQKPSPTGDPAEQEKPKVPRYKKTYGIRGFMEYQLKLPTGYQSLPLIELKFEGGQFTGFGVAPACLTTDDPILQKIIEGSYQFEDKFIELIKTVTL